jgi:hypothetical protein
MGQAHESAVLLLVIGRTRRATMQFLCAENRFQRDGALRNGFLFQWELKLRPPKSKMAR